VPDQPEPYIAPPPTEYGNWTLFRETTAICPNCNTEADEKPTDDLGELLAVIDNHECEEVSPDAT
jgi:hypothetical protein